MQKILVVDDDRDMCLLLKGFLSRHGYEVKDILNGKKALEIADSFEPDLVLTDFRLEDMDGLQLLIKIKEKTPQTQVIIMTGYSDIKLAVEVMKLGAFDYVTKPLLPDEILLTIRKALNAPAIIPEASQPATIAVTPDKSNAPKTPATDQEIVYSGDYIFGNSPQFLNILKQIELVGPTNFSVIIYGESGSGKEVIAQEIHNKSKRMGKPFIAIDCGAMSKELAGSELFGHEKGAFTGAVNQKTGSFELANGGTIFLDEIANLPYDVQVSLLRVIQERTMRRVGGTRDIELDVRIIIASNERLWESSRSGKFREDLYHRFNEFSIDVPPLRDRKEDIMIFARHFLKQTNRELEKNVKDFTPEVEHIFMNYIWHGNLRELKNVTKRATLLADGEYIESRFLPFEISNFAKLQFNDTAQNAVMEQQNTYKSQDSLISESNQTNSFANSSPGYAHNSGGNTDQIPGKHIIHDLSLKSASLDAEYEMIVEALKQVNFNKSKAARLLNIDRKTLYNKMKQYQDLINK